MKTIHTKHAPDAIGPYSQAKQAGGFIFLSGQIGIDPAAGNIIVSDIAGQTEQVCKNIKAILKKAETSMDNVVKTTCFLTDMKDFAPAAAHIAVSSRNKFLKKYLMNFWKMPVSQTAP